MRKLQGNCSRGI